MTQGKGARLVWDRETSKQEPPSRLIETERVYPSPVFSSDDLFGTALKSNQNRNVLPVNRLIQGDNLVVLEKLLADGYGGKIDLIYIDPPYLSESRYFSRVELEDGPSKIVMQRKVFDDSWGNGMNSYLDHIFPRLRLMKELLSDQGSIFVHLDWHGSHYVKVLLDEIFSPTNMVNEIIWCYGGGSGARRHFHRKHDVILWYSKGPNYIFNPQYRPYTTGTRERGLTRVKGDKYKLKEEGAIMNDWWSDINKILSPTAHENLKFPTQKPLALLKRIILTASNPGSIVADFYCGSGTLADACEDADRTWIACDNGPIAIHTTMHRLIKSQSRPFVVQKVMHNNGEEIPGQLNGIGAEVHRFKPEVNQVMLSLESVSIQDLPAGQSLFFWALDLDHTRPNFVSDLQIIREKTKGGLPHDITLSFPGGHPISIGVRAYDWWGREYYGHFELKSAP